MSDTVWVVLIISITIVVILFLFRRQLSDFIFKANKEGVEARLKTHRQVGVPNPDQPTIGIDKPHSVNISKNRLWGKKNKIDVNQSANVSDNQLIGQDQEIRIGPKRKGRQRK